jgi:hypothetical protein
MPLRRQPFLAVFAVMCVLAPSMAERAHAQPAQSFDELIASNRLSAGEVINVRDTAGHETKGVFSDFRNKGLVLLVGKQGIEQSFVEGDVDRIRRAGGNATAWGAAIGGGVAFLATFAVASKYGENEGGKLCGACLVQWGAFAVPAGAGIGAAVGLNIDRQQRQTLFVAPPRPRRAVLTMP